MGPDDNLEEEKIEEGVDDMILYFQSYDYCKNLLQVLTRATYETDTGGVQLEENPEVWNWFNVNYLPLDPKMREMVFLGMCGAISGLISEIDRLRKGIL